MCKLVMLQYIELECKRLATDRQTDGKAVRQTDRQIKTATQRSRKLLTTAEAKTRAAATSCNVAKT